MAASRTHYLIYVRQSYRRDDDADVSEEQQEEAARRLLPKGSTHEVIRDTGGHRSGRTENRDGYRLLIARMAEGDVSGVAAYDLSRLARNAHLMLNLKQELDARNLRLIVSNLPDSRFDTAVGRFLFGQLCLAAQFQADLDSERMVAITRTKHEQGGHNGSDPYGYRTARTPEGKVEQPHRLAIVPEEGDVVRYVFDAYGAEQHCSHGALAAHLNESGTLRRGSRGETKASVTCWAAQLSTAATPSTVEAKMCGRDRTSRSSRPSSDTWPSAWHSAAAALAVTSTLTDLMPSKGSSTAAAGAGCAARR